MTHETSKFTRGKAGGIRRLPHQWQRTVNALGDHFEGLKYEYGIFKLLVRVVISDK